MASKLRNRKKADESAGQSSSTEDGDEFSASNIAAKIHQRRLPRRTPTTHVKSGESPVSANSVKPRNFSTNHKIEENSEKNPPPQKLEQTSKIPSAMNARDFFQRLDSQSKSTTSS